MGVGAGGPSQLGRKSGLDEAASAALLSRVFDRGVNFVDSSEGYGTEPIIGRALRDPQSLQTFIDPLIEKGQIDPGVTAQDIAAFLLEEGHAASLPDAAYRFCRDEPGVHVVLSGTGNAGHLEANLESFGRPPLPDEDTEKLRTLFCRVDSTTGQ